MVHQKVKLDFHLSLIHISSAAEEELADAKNAMSVLFSKLVENYHYELPNGDSRQITILEKKKETPNKYPRKAGMPNKKPL